MKAALIAVIATLAIAAPAAAHAETLSYDVPGLGWSYGAGPPQAPAQPNQTVHNRYQGRRPYRVRVAWSPVSGDLWLWCRGPVRVSVQGRWFACPVRGRLVGRVLAGGWFREVIVGEDA